MASEVGVLDIPPEDILRQGAAASRPDASSSTPRKGASSTTRRSSASWPPNSPYGEWLRRHLVDIDDLPRGAAPSGPITTTVLPPAAGVRLHAGGPADAARADGPRRRGADRLDGHRHVAGGAVGPAAAALRLFQAAVRAGHQPAARRDSRGAGDVDGLDDRPRRATCSRPEPESCRQIKIAYPIIDNDHVAKLRHLPPGSPFRSTTLPMLFDPAEDGPGLERAMERLCAQGQPGGAPPATAS